MLRRQVVQKHVDYQEITHVIGHTWSVYIIGLIKMMLFLVCLYILYVFLSRYFPSNQTMQWIFGGAGLFFYAKGMVDFLNHYLDCMVLTSLGIVVFKREGLLTYQTDTFARERIETVSHTQNSLWDKLLQKGDIVITLERGLTYGFRDVYKPMDYANAIIRKKQSYLTDLHDDDSAADDKFELLVETLGEVIHDYMGNKQSTPVADHSYREQGMFE